MLSHEGGQKADEVFHEYEAAILKEIAALREHIVAVEHLITIVAINIPIENEVYVTAGKLATAKKAPFHNKTNSFGDAVILLSAVEYFKGSGYEWIGNTIFVSNNSDDYSAAKGSKQIHPDLEPYFRDADIAFELNIARALDLSQDLSAQIDEYIHYQESREFCSANCKGEMYSTNIVVFESQRIFPEGTELLVFNPNQTKLFPGPEYSMTEEEVNTINDAKKITLKIGTCQHCNAINIECDCGQEHYTYDDPFQIDCSCGKEIFNDVKGKIYVIEN